METLNRKEGSEAYGCFWRRLLAFLIDEVVIAVAILPIIILIIVIAGVENLKLFIADWQQSPFEKIPQYLVHVLYLGFFWASGWQATVGNRLLRLKIGEISGTGLSFKKAFLRALLVTVPLAALFAASAYQQTVKGSANEVEGLPIFGIALVFCCIWYGSIAFTKEKTALHYLLIKSRVFKL